MPVKSASPRTARHLVDVSTPPTLTTLRRTATAEDDAARARTSEAIRRAKQGDSQAIDELYRAYAGRVYGYACRMLRDDHEAEDVTQQVFAKLFTVLRQYEERGVPFGAWILRITHNTVIDHMRRRRAVPCEEVRSVTQAFDTVGDERRASLTEALAALPDEQRDVVVLRHVLGLSPSEIAGRLERSEAAIHGLHHRGRRALREALVRMDAAPTTRAA